MSLLLENFIPGTRNTRQFLAVLTSFGCSECHPFASKRGQTASQKISFDLVLLLLTSPVKNLIIPSEPSDEQSSCRQVAMNSESLIGFRLVRNKSSQIMLPFTNPDCLHKNFCSNNGFQSEEKFLQRCLTVTERSENLQHVRAIQIR